MAERNDLNIFNDLKTEKTDEDERNALDICNDLITEETDEDEASEALKKRLDKYEKEIDLRDPESNDSLLHIVTIKRKPR